ncbi:unnamed protein product [Parascedosporium putredinis]|uniref:LYC1 C-terminal domain-containing protein n=1 Tax=Parascedosporium putredinis TaxID=1442378 RepID=A0A9P1GUF5_9PEZI|nr:unnamed protein product [Parascedosporium putredinis]CAI7987844.1 unnamed protein product [Parascedosporium putredinis]
MGKLHFSDVTFGEATAEQRMRTWQDNGAVWAGPLTLEDYIAREATLAETPQCRDGNCRYWVLARRDDPLEIISSCETPRKKIFVRQRWTGGHVSEEDAYAVASVHTHPKYRARGMAAYLLGEVVKFLDDKVRWSFLYSDIGRQYYASMGWNVFRAEQMTMTILEPGFVVPDGRIAAMPEDGKTHVAIVPTQEQLAWQHASAGFSATHITGRAIENIGAISPGGDSWVLWYHDFREKQLKIQRAALVEAAAWGFKEVLVWGPGDAVTLGAKALANGSRGYVKLVWNDRLEHSLPSLRWREDDTDSEDDELQMNARNSRELRAHDRIMLMEEEEVENLVTKTRKSKAPADTGSTFLNPFSLFGRNNRVHDESANTSTEDLSEKKRIRRSRRREKRERLKEQAEHGEDGELMYEMEEGGMKDGSSTGESSEDSEEMDQNRLNVITKAKADRKRSRRRWILIHTIIVAVFAVFVLVAWKLTADRKRMAVASQVFSNGTALFGPTTVIISLDGFRPDFLQRGLTPRLNAFIREGVSPKYMLPSFPSVTFPNHYTLATGLYPESHGIVGNTFFDPTLNGDFFYTDPTRSLDPKWWMGEPFWVTAEKQGVRAAIHMWPGSEAHIMNTEPSFLDEYNGKEPLEKKVDRLFEFLDLPGRENKDVQLQDTRPQLIAMYVPNVDSDGHTYGPNSTEINKTINQVDTMMDNIFHGLEQRNLTNIVNIIVVSDHGMATTDVTRLTQLDDIVDLDKVSHIDGWPLVGLRPKDPEDLQSLYDQAMNNTRDNPNIEVYLRDVDMPERYHFSKNERIAPLWLIPKAGWG